MKLRILNPNEQLTSIFGESSFQGFSSLETSVKETRDKFITMKSGSSQQTEMFSYQSPYLKNISNHHKLNQKSLEVSPIPLNPNHHFEANDTLFTSEIDIINFEDQKENTLMKTEEILDKFSTTVEKKKKKEIRNLEKIKNINVFNLEKNILNIHSSHYKRGLKLYKDGLFFSTNLSNKLETGISGFTGYGLFWYKTGDIYIGSWLRGLPHGYGYFYFIENGIYFGEIKGGLANGKGLFFKPEQNFFYEGEFKAGEMSGKGSIVFKKKGYDVKMHKGKIAYSELLGNNCFKHKVCPSEIKSHDDEFEYLSMWMNPLTRQFMDNFLYNAKKRNKFWKKIYFGEREGKIKHGAGTIFRCDGSRFHGMFYDNKALGLGISVDCNNNFELGFYKNKKVEIFGVNHLVKGDVYAGGFKKGVYSGPGVCFNHNLDRWMFGYFENGEVAQSGINRASKIMREHYFLGDLMDVLVRSAFGEIKILRKKLGKNIMEPSKIFNEGEVRSITEQRKIDDRVYYENQFFARRWKNYFQGEVVLERKKKIFGPEWEAQKMERNRDSKFDLKLDLTQISPPRGKKKFQPDFDLSGIDHSPHARYHDNHRMLRTHDEENLEKSSVEKFNEIQFPISVKDTEKDHASRRSWNTEVHFIREKYESKTRKTEIIRQSLDTLSSQRSRDQSRSLEKRFKILQPQPPKPNRRYNYKEKIGSQKTTNYSRNGTNGDKIGSEGMIGDPLSSERKMRGEKRKNFESSRYYNESPVKKSEKKGYESLAANFETKSIGSRSDDLDFSDGMSMGEEQDHYF